MEPFFLEIAYRCGKIMLKLQEHIRSTESVFYVEGTYRNMPFKFQLVVDGDTCDFKIINHGYLPRKIYKLQPLITDKIYSRLM